MLQLVEEQRPKKQHKYKKEAQIDPQKEYQKIIDVKGNVFIFNMRGRTILNEREFYRFVTYMNTYIRPFVATNFNKILGMEFDELYNEFVYRLWRCIATFDNGETARIKERASFLTYYMSILQKDFENKRVVRDKSRTIARLKEQGKHFEANLVHGLVYATSLSDLEPWQIDMLGTVEIDECLSNDDDE